MTKLKIKTIEKAICMYECTHFALPMILQKFNNVLQTHALISPVCTIQPETKNILCENLVSESQFYELPQTTFPSSHLLLYIYEKAYKKGHLQNAFN